MIFSNFSSIDVNINKDITQGEDTSKTCIWFTIPLASYVENDESTGDEVTNYEYASFPITARGEQDITFFTLNYPYFPNIKYVTDSL